MKDEIESVFFEHVRRDAQRSSDAGEAPDTTKLSSHPQTLVELWRTRDQVVAAMDSIEALAKKFQGPRTEHRSVLKLLWGTKAAFLNVIKEIERRQLADKIIEREQNRLRRQNVEKRVGEEAS